MRTKLIYFLIIFTAFRAHCAYGQNVVNFSADEGFTNGPLYTQPNWDSNYQTSTWMVDAVQGIVVTSSQWKRAAWKQGFSMAGVAGLA